jgi:hypothetical protein
MTLTLEEPFDSRIEWSKLNQQMSQNRVGINQIVPWRDLCLQAPSINQGKIHKAKFTLTLYFRGKTWSKKDIRYK